MMCVCVTQHTCLGGAALGVPVRGGGRGRGPPGSTTQAVIGACPSNVHLHLCQDDLCGPSQTEHHCAILTGIGWRARIATTWSTCQTMIPHMLVPITLHSWYW